MGIYKAKARTPQKAFENIWLLLQYTDDYALREVKGGWEIRLEVKEPTKQERENFEIKKL